MSTTSAVARPASIKLYYGQLNFWRAECIRIGLFVGGVPFEDIRDKQRPELNAAGKLPFGATPVLEVDGKVLSQTQAMAAYVGKLGGIHPEDPWGQAKVDEALNGCTDVTLTLRATMSLPEEEKVPTREKLIGEGGRLRMHVGGLNRLCEENGSNGHAYGETLTVADIAVWRLLGWLTGGVVDGIPKEWVPTTFPALAKLIATVNAHEKVIEWKQLHPNQYPVAA